MERNEIFMMPYDKKSETVQENSLFILYEQFLKKYREERNPSERTVIALNQIIPRFLKFYALRDGGDLNHVTPEDVVAYLNSLSIRTTSKTTHRVYIVMFFNYLFKLKLMKVKLPLVQYKGPPDIPRAPQKDLDDEEIAKMIKNKDSLSIKERVIFYFLISRPLRIGELVNLKIRNVNLEDKTFAIVKSKNKKTRILSIPAMTYKELLLLIGDRDSEERVFGVSGRTMYNLVDNIYRKLGIEKKGRSGHAFRHSVIMDMLYKLKRDNSVVAEDAGNTAKTIMSHYTNRIPTNELRSAEKELDRLRSKIVVH